MTGRTAAAVIAQAGPALSAESRLAVLYAILASTALLVLIFLAVIAIMRRLRPRQRGRRAQPTEYVDAWSQVRITEEEIERYAPQSDDDEPRHPAS